METFEKIKKLRKNAEEIKAKLLELSELDNIS